MKAHDGYLNKEISPSFAHALCTTSCLIPWACSTFPFRLVEMLL